MKNKVFKNDMNFIEFPLWFQNERLAKSEDWSFKDRDGFTYKSGYKATMKRDFIHLFAMLLLVQEQDWNPEIRVTQYEILKLCGWENSGTPAYKRLRDSLERWMHVVITFSGTFFDGKDYKIMQFHILDHWRIDKETGDLVITFSPSFLKQQQNTTFFKYIDFEELRMLETSLSTRLYEILRKSFQKQDQWKIGARKLAEKIPLKRQQPSHVIPKIHSALQHINEKTSQQFSLSVKRPRRGEAILTFTKMEVKENTPEKAKVLIIAEEQREAYEACLKQVKQQERHKKTVQKMLQKSLLKYDLDYVIRNVRYANKRVKKNYRLFLKQSLEKDWGKEEAQERKEKQQLIQKQKEVKKVERKREKEKSKHSQELLESVKRVLTIMSESEKKKLEVEAKKQLGFDEEKDYSSTSVERIAIRMMMSDLLIKKLFN